jgi:hypothetical protein
MALGSPNVLPIALLAIVGLLFYFWNGPIRGGAVRLDSKKE